MHRSSDSIDESSRLKQFAWEQWDDQVIAVIFRPGSYGLDRYVVKRYAEQVLYQSQRWKQLSLYFSSISPSIRAYSLTSYEMELMRRIFDYHLGEKLPFRITQSNDQLIGYEDLLDFIAHAQKLSNSNPLSQKNIFHSNNEKKPSIPSIHSSYILPSTIKPLMSLSSTSNELKTYPVKSSSINNSLSLQSNKLLSSKIVTNSQHSTQSSNNSSNISIPPELCPTSLHTARIDGSGWVQINNVYLPFIVKNRQRLVPYQVLVACKILELDELRSILIRASSADIILINSMIRECKINNEQIPENAFLINVYHILIGTKNFIYVKILPKANPTSKINRQYKSILALQGGAFSITTRIIPYICTSNHTYLPLDSILNIYPNLYAQLKALARVPRTNELDYLQLVQMYYDGQELPLDTLLIDIEDLNQTQIIPSKNMTLIEHHAREKSKLEQQIILLNNSLTNKRKNQETHDNKQIQQKLKTSNQIQQSTTTSSRPPTGYYPLPSSSNQQNYYLSSNNGCREKTRWQ
ncbi:unnamed protein product [Adineta steineri]|uniref:Uncharacterized protein n=1 Tax=Adineta steineri TaxID=433720 RepID=A0A815RD85_9BILA|nr:unnamed protein product [Adineta steineri]CAF3951616.1 unnamed protein product [Adineta steineri]